MWVVPYFMIWMINSAASLACSSSYIKAHLYPCDLL